MNTIQAILKTPMGRLYYAVGSILFVDLGFGGRVIEALRSPGGALWANASFEILGLIGLLMIVMAMRLSDSSRPQWWAIPWSIGAAAPYVLSLDHRIHTAVIVALSIIVQSPLFLWKSKV